MKYFTTDWWGEGCTDQRPVHDYQAYFSSVADKLPIALVELERTHTLHDARVEGISSRFQEQVVVISLMGWDQSFRERTKYVLEFGGVRELSQSLPHGRSVESELGDLGYWEYELEAGVVEMRLLFASGAEFSIKFACFSFHAKSEHGA